jgi:hypothetical protein
MVVTWLLPEVRVTIASASGIKRLCCCAAGSQQSSLISARGGTSSAVEQAVAVPRPLPFVTKACVHLPNSLVQAAALTFALESCMIGISATHRRDCGICESRA